MPLSFDSLYHGSVAFGFFNIDSDMLLLEEWFFFADLFCDRICRLSTYKGTDRFETEVEAYPFSDPADIGNLMEAIHRIRLSGFFGDVYRQFPFPDTLTDFKQKPDGGKNQEIMKKMISVYTDPQRLVIAVDPKKERISINGYSFSKEVFHELLLYLWRGGYPRWKADLRPSYVTWMREKIQQSQAALFQGIEFPP